MGLLLATAVALALGVAAPLDVVVFGLLAVGMVHVALEVRYVSGRYRGVLHGRLLVALNVVLVAIVVNRLLLAGVLPRRVEVVVMVAILLAAVARSGSRVERAVGLVIVGGAGAFALARPETWFVVQANLHNLVPAVFLWEWSAGLADCRGRRAVRGATLAWAVAVPALLLLGALDPWLSTGSAAAAGAGSSVLGSILLEPNGALGARLLALFAFAQVMHYVTWCWFFPRHAPEATAAFEATPVGHRLRGPRLLGVAVAVTAVVALVAWHDYGEGRTLYTSLATYHAYLEFPVLVVLAMAWAARTRRPPGSPDRGVARAGGPSAWLGP